MDTLQKGDLIHIPQGVSLVAHVHGTVKSTLKTDRPRTAIFLGSHTWKGLDRPALVFLDGKEFMVRSDHIYLLKEKEKRSNVG